MNLVQKILRSIRVADAPPERLVESLASSRLKSFGDPDILELNHKAERRLMSFPPEIMESALLRGLDHVNVDVRQACAERLFTVKDTRVTLAMLDVLGDSAISSYAFLHLKTVAMPEPSARGLPQDDFSDATNAISDFVNAKISNELRTAIASENDAERKQVLQQALQRFESR